MLACGTAALASAVLAAPLALSGAVEASTVAVVVLLQLALVEPYAAITTAVRQYPALRAVLRRIGEAGVLDGTDADAGRRRVRRAGSRGRQARRQAPGSSSGTWPRRGRAGRRSSPASTATAEPGRWLAVTGASGSGKSTLLAVVLGFLPAARRPDPAQRAGGLVPAGGAPLRLDHPRQPAAGASRRPTAGDEPEQRLQDALAAVGLGPLVGRLEHGLDTRIGPGGAFLSGGERQRLAVARTLLTGADVILLDEPTAHLDAESGRAMLAELRHGLRDRTVVLVTHNPEDISPDDSRLDLDRAAALAAAPTTGVDAVAGARVGRTLACCHERTPRRRATSQPGPPPAVAARRDRDLDGWAALIARTAAVEQPVWFERRADLEQVLDSKKNPAAANTILGFDQEGVARAYGRITKNPDGEKAIGYGCVDPAVAGHRDRHRAAGLDGGKDPAAIRRGRGAGFHPQAAAPHGTATHAPGRPVRGRRLPDCPLLQRDAPAPRRTASRRRSWTTGWNSWASAPSCTSPSGWRTTRPSGTTGAASPGTRRPGASW